VSIGEVDSFGNVFVIASQAITNIPTRKDILSRGNKSDVKIVQN
jgi:hypothetical protein